MKASIKLTAGIIVASISVLEAFHSSNQMTLTPKTNPQYKLVHKYSNHDVELLMKGNHWTKAEATHFLELYSSNTVAVGH